MDSYIGIIAAEDKEMKAIKDIMINVEEINIYDLTFYKGILNNKKCLLVKCGIGKVNAARTTQILIDKFNIDHIINLGSAGALNDKLKIGDIVVGEKLIQHDFDLRPFNYERGYIPNVGKYIPCDEYLLRIASKIELESKSYVGTIASGDIFITESLMGEKINNKFNALCVEMEGASIAQICYLSHIPFLVIRSISDSPNKEANNYKTFDEFLEYSSNMIGKFLLEVLNNIA